jgi:6-phosphofructokinase
MKKVGIINGGGDTQAINAVIASVVRSGINRGYKFIGFIKGWEGLLDMDYVPLELKDVRGISHIGGTILQTTNKGRFSAKAGEGNVRDIPQDIIDLAKKNYKDLDLECLIVIGGDGTLTGAQQLFQEGVNVIGIPKTIDNDLSMVDRTFGFSTAVDIVVEALDRIHTTALSHNRVFFVETMGRYAGWIALNAGLAGGANAILIPEIKFDYPSLIKFLSWRKKIGKNYSIVVVAEGAREKNGDFVKDTTNTTSENKLGGISYDIMERIEAESPGEFEMRNVILGHTQRGGAPNAEDRILAKIYGTSAIDALEAKRFGQMVCLVKGNMQTVAISEAIAKLKTVTPDDLGFQSARKLGIYFGEPFKS